MNKHDHPKINFVLKNILSILHEDGTLDCNQYQGNDFNKLLQMLAERLKERKP